MTLREIGNKYGFTYEQMHNFITRYNAKQRKIKAGIGLKAKGRTSKAQNLYGSSSPHR